MDHVVYLDSAAKEMEKLLAGTKSMVIRGAAGRKMPYGRVHTGDVLYFMNNNAEGLIKAKGIVTNVLNSDKLTTEESVKLVEDHHSSLQLTEKQLKRWSGKRYLVLVEVAEIKEVTPFAIDKSDYGNMDDWLPVEQVENVLLKD